MIISELTFRTQSHVRFWARMFASIVAVEGVSSRDLAHRPGHGVHGGLYAVGRLAQCIFVLKVTTV